MKNLSLCLVLVLLIQSKLSFGQNDKSPALRHLISVVERYQKRLTPEKVYIHTDKATYFIGDTIWFKAYTLDKRDLSASDKSQLLYVELNDDSLVNVKRVSIPLSYGIGWAQIPLSVKQFHEGTYTLRAYTNWMQNLSEDRFFKQRIYIGKPTAETWQIQANTQLVDKAPLTEVQVKMNIARLNKQPVTSQSVQAIVMEKDKVLIRKDLKTTPNGELDLAFDLKDKVRSENLRLYIVNTQKGERGQTQSVPLLFNRPQNIDLQFFPEGGNWVAGISSTVGFKAINEDGRSANVSGGIYDSQNKKVSDFKTTHNGMGTVEMAPVAGETYTARIDAPNGNGVVYQLPKVNAEGTVIHFENREKDDSLTVKFAFSPGLKGRDKYSLVGEARDFVSYSGMVEPKDGAYSIPKKIFPSGIVHFTLFKDTIPVSERIVFIDHKDQFKLNVTADKPVYATKDSVVLNLAVNDSKGKPVKEGSFSLSVTDDSKVRADTAGNSNIATTLLLTSDLKGYVEDPAYYFNSGNADRLKALDNLMLTQGWIGLSWKDVFKTTKPKFRAEEQFVITGKVISAFKKPVEGAQVLVSSKKPVFIKQTLTDKKGVYTFKDLPLLDTSSFLIVASTPKGKMMRYGELTVDRFEPAPIPDELVTPMQPWFVNTDSITQRAVNATIEKLGDDMPKNSGQILKGVTITGRKVIPHSDNINGAGNADIVFDEKDIKEAGVINLYEFLQQQLPGFRIVMRDGFPAIMFDKYYMGIKIDNIPLSLNVDGPVPTVASVIEAMKEHAVDSYIGVEVMTSRKFTRIGPSGTSIGIASYSPDAQKVAMAANSVKPWGYNREEGRDDYVFWRLARAIGRDLDAGIIEITTRFKTGQYRYDFGPLNRVKYRPIYTLYARDFYSPKYTVKDKLTEPDLRTTIYWSPDIVTDDKGRARVVFYTGDKAGKYSVILQGADLQGGIGSQYLKLNVE